MQKSLMLKIGMMIGLTLSLLIPLGMIDGLITERTYRQQEVVNDIAASSAGQQRLFGPILVVPYSEEWVEVVETRQDGVPKREERQHTEHQVLYFLPDQLNVDGEIATETKRRGLFKVRSYVLDAVFQGSFTLPSGYDRPSPQHRGRIVMGAPYVAATVADMRGVLETTGLNWNGQNHPFEQGTGLTLGQTQAGMHAELAVLPVSDGHTPIRFDFGIKLRGLESLDFIPAGKQTRVGLSSPWPHPSFHGRFLPNPASQSIGPEGFHADWSVAALSSNVADGLERGQDIAFFDSFGLKLVDPINIYSLSDRASKYGFLFVCLTFSAIFLFEILKRYAIHPAQYAMVGLALAIFFLLLLSLSEHIVFPLAYAISAFACVGLIAYYLSAVLRSNRRGLSAGVLLSGLFGALYGLLQSEDNALMLGSLLLFGLLAVAMVATRGVDWYRLGSPRAEALG